MRYLKGDPIEDPQQDYDIDQGIVVDRVEKPTARRNWTAMSRYYRPTKADREAEEASWAARSGPVYVVRPPRE